MEVHGPGRPTGIFGEGNGPTSTDGESGEGRTGGPECGQRQALIKSQEKRRLEREGKGLPSGALP